MDILFIGGVFPKEQENEILGKNHGVVHSAFFDELAKCGMLGAGALFVALFSDTSFAYRHLEHSKQKMVYYCSIVAFFILGIINTLLFVPVIFAACFAVHSWNDLGLFTHGFTGKDGDT